MSAGRAAHRDGRLRRLLRGRPSPRVRDREVPGGVRRAVRGDRRQLDADRRRLQGRAPEGPGLPVRQGARRRHRRAWEIWQANGMDAASAMAHTEAVKLGEAYWLVEPPANGSSDAPRITVEHPSQVIVACAPGDRRKRLAALKKWVDEDGYVYANVYLPDGIAKYRSARRPGRPEDPVAAAPGRPGRRAQPRRGAGRAAVQRADDAQAAGAATCSSSCRSRTR
jgi:hypothetical protein